VVETVPFLDKVKNNKKNTHNNSLNNYFDRYLENYFELIRTSERDSKGRSSYLKPFFLYDESHEQKGETIFISEFFRDIQSFFRVGLL